MRSRVVHPSESSPLLKRIRIKKKDQSPLPNVRNNLVWKRLWVINGRCRDRYGLHQCKAELVSFCPGVSRQCGLKGKKSQDMVHTSHISTRRLGCLGRSWPILAGLSRGHFFEKTLSGTEVTEKPLETSRKATKAKVSGMQRKRGR